MLQVNTLLAIPCAIILATILSNCAFISNEDELNLIKQPKANNRVTNASDWVSFGKNRYKGQIKSNRPHGSGEYHWANGASYRGQFNLGLMQGYGRWSLSNGDVYVGSFVNDRPHGKGVFTFNDGSVYDGIFKKGFIDGQGTLKSKDGFILKGQFKNTDRKYWELNGTVEHATMRSWCKGKFSFTRRLKPSKYLSSYQTLLKTPLSYANNYKCRIAQKGLIFSGNSLKYAKLPVANKKFWSSLKTIPYIKAEFDDGATLVGSSSKAKLHGVFTWKSADGLEKAIQVWRDGVLLASSPQGTKTSPCQLKNSNHKWLVIRGTCKNGFLDDTNGTAILMNAPRPVSLVGKFIKGQLSKGQIQRVKIGGNNNIYLRTTQADNFTMQSNGTIVPIGKTLIAERQQVVFEGSYPPGGYGSGVCLYQGAFESCQLNVNGERIDAVARARKQALYAEYQVRERRKQQQLKVEGCNSAIKYLNDSLDELVQSYDKSKCPAEAQRAARILQDNINGDNFYRGGDKELGKQTRQCIAYEQRELKSDLQYISKRESSVRNQCTGIQEGFLPQMRAYKRSIIDSFQKRKNGLEARISNLASLWHDAKRASQRADQQRQAQYNRDIIASIRKQGDYNAFLDSIGADRSSSGVMAQSRNILKNYNDNVYKRQLAYQNAYQAAQLKAKRLDASRPEPRVDTSAVINAYARARQSCRRTNDSWDEANKRCTPKDKITTYTINLLPPACYGDGPYCKQSNEGYAIHRSTGNDNKGTNGRVANNASGHASGASSNNATGENSGGRTAGINGNSGNTLNNPYSGSQTQNKPEPKPKSQAEAYAVCKLASCGKWFCEGPLQSTDICGNGSQSVVKELEGTCGSHAKGKPRTGTKLSQGSDQDWVKYSCGFTCGEISWTNGGFMSLPHYEKRLKKRGFSLPNGCY